MNRLVILFAVSLSVLLACAQVMFKLSAEASKLPAAAVRSYAFLGGALALYFTVFVLYAYALRRLELSVLYPTYTALSVLLTCLAGIVYFGEQWTIRTVVGCLLLIAAVFVLSVDVPRA